MNIFTIDGFNFTNTGSRANFVDDPPMFISDWQEVQVISKVKFICSCGFVIINFEMRTEGVARDQYEAMRQALERLLNYEIYDFDMFHEPCPFGCKPDYSKIHVFEFSSWEEPWRSLFESLFSNSGWILQKQLIQPLKQIDNVRS